MPKCAIPRFIVEAAQTGSDVIRPKLPIRLLGLSIPLGSSISYNGIIPVGSFDFDGVAMQRLTAIGLLMASSWAGSAQPPLSTEAPVTAAQPASQRNLDSDSVQTDRYTQVSLKPSLEQQDPLKAIVKTRFPQGSVATVGEAMDYLLARSGYQIASTPNRDPKVQALFSLPLPAVHRDIGPVRLDTALSMLAGSGYAVVYDRVNRLVSVDLLRPKTVPTAP